MVFLKEFFEKDDYEKKLKMEKECKITRWQSVYREQTSFLVYSGNFNHEPLSLYRNWLWVMVQKQGVQLKENWFLQ